MIHSYTVLNNPVAQIAAAEAFCENLLAHPIETGEEKR
jgi:hypothetical protein